MKGTYQEYIDLIFNKWKDTNANPLSLLTVEKYTLCETTSFHITGTNRNKKKILSMNSHCLLLGLTGYIAMLDLKMPTGTLLWQFSV